MAFAQPATAADTPIHPPHAFTLPCSVVLNPLQEIPNARGAALFFDVREKYTETVGIGKKQHFSIVANYLPAPSSFGDYDTYEGFSQIPGLISWRMNLVPSVYITSGVHGVQRESKEYIWVGNWVGITCSFNQGDESAGSLV